MLEATLQMERGEPAAAIVALYRDPHPTLRAVLARTFADLGDAAAARGRPADEVDVYRVEAEFVASVDAVAAEGPTSAAAIVHSRRMLERTGLDDARTLVLAALAVIDDDPDGAVLELARIAQAKDLRVAQPHRRLMAGIERPLMEFPEWREVLER